MVKDKTVTAGEAALSLTNRNVLPILTWKVFIPCYKLAFFFFRLVLKERLVPERCGSSRLAVFGFLPLCAASSFASCGARISLDVFGHCFCERDFSGS